MDSSLAFKVGLVVLGGAGAVGGGIALNKGISSNSGEVISKVLEKSLMNFTDSNLSDKWNARKTKLGQSKDEDLVLSLKKIKDKSNYTADDIKNWCRDNVNGFLNDDGGRKMKNVSSYCTFNVKDKITKPLVNGNWNTANGKVKTVEDRLLSPPLRTVKAELNKGSGADSDALKKWCNSTYEQMFKGENDTSFVEASSYCTTP
ncbi:hypothetical protein MHC_02060 [Mycoplasma haemocanis str. Illinois]|uniref:Uncharacterized protein n=1 Tax=Mycoplasma haemocanis (strain Illinois) TaxID=1111676 RepID=H6N6K6_MYCHN|nr:hypothetical protein [Mycoplasma haemocanis]AEW45278.1 hypothetical protein MHC_02060 [Mycoplasma haemocanis str. Illinois]